MPIWPPCAVCGKRTSRRNPSAPAEPRCKDHGGVSVARQPDRARPETRRQAVAAYEDRQAAKGRCRSCKEPVHRAGLCEQHYSDALARQREAYTRRKASGLCVKCETPAAPGSIYCAKHRKGFNARERARYQADKG